MTIEEPAGDPLLPAPYAEPAPDVSVAAPDPFVRPVDEGWQARLRKLFAPVIAAGAFLLKFGAVLLKLKVLTVVGTMGVSVAAYALLWGWKFALGFVLLIFVHEMGHAVMLRRRGIRAGLPIFLPFLGAFISMKSQPASVYEEAESALAGPVAGTIGSFVVWWAGNAIGSPMLVSLAFTGFLLNLFNLLPALPLDGGRVAGALHPAIWLLGLGALLVAEFVRPSPVIPVILLLGGFELWRRWRDRGSAASQVYFALEPRQRWRIGGAYLGLVVVLLLAMHASYAPRPLPS
ncbi:MAG TPA: site-2 protease family protein [Mycobacteriales bacterium]|nr:site-2 protease family protein [Mycobacteriales bacterium]